MVMVSAAILVTLGLAAAEPSARRELVDRIVAVVNDDVVTLSELKKLAGPLLDETAPEKRDALLKTVLDQLIAEKLLTQQVREAKIEVTNDEIDRAIEDITRQHKITKEELRQAVEQRGMSFAQYREDLERQLVRLKLVDLKVRSRVVVPESDIKAEYERQAALEKKDEMVQLRHLFFRWGEDAPKQERARVLEKAKKARERIVAGEDFAEVAKQVSEGPTAANGGDLGEVSKQGLLPELARAVARLPKGEISQPIETDNGVHVVRVEGFREKEATSFEQVKNQIYQRLYTQEVERQMRLWIDELRAQAAVDVRL